MYKIMLVEDEPPILNMMEDMINSSDAEFEVSSTAYNGRDALRILESEVPDVIITDIRMPFVNGLEIIKKVNELYPRVICVILSGYNDFEYARSALRQRVFDYLLKPIQPDLLDSLLERLFEHIKKESLGAEYRYFNNLINNEQTDLETKMSLSLPYKMYYIVLVYAGTLSSYQYDYLNPRRDFWNSIDISDLSSRLISKDKKLWILNSKYFNGKIFIFSSNSESDNYMKSACSLMMDYLKLEDMPVNIISGLEISNIQDMPQVVNRLNSILTREIIFGKSNVFFEENKNPSNPIVSPDMEEKIGKIARINNYDTFRKNLKILIDEFENSKYTQLLIQTVLNRLVNLVFTSQKGLWVDINEIVNASNNYEELYQNICIVFKHFFESETEKHTYNLSAKELVDKIEKYLDTNYTKNITYKVFNEMFGYNETYITNVFRKVKGISPSKYITKLRIEKAKDIITKQPDILLKNVSDMVGYDDPLYFSRVFRDMTGFSPSEYVKKLLNKDNI